MAFSCQFGTSPETCGAIVAPTEFAVCGEHTRNLGQPLLDRSKIESKVGYLGIDVDDALVVGTICIRPATLAALGSRRAAKGDPFETDQIVFCHKLLTVIELRGR
jgi:hypothetical protein